MRAAVYLRQSLDREQTQLAISRQREDCLKLCQQRGWQPVEYVDNSISASSGRVRPAYRKMLADVAEGRVGAVVVWNLDRLHRRPIELEHFMTLADEHHLALATVSGDVDLSTAQGRLIARLMGGVAAHETEHKKARQRRAARQKAELGRPKWRTAFGYLPETRHREDDDGTRQPDPVTAPLVRQAYAAVRAGASLNDICRLFNDAGAHGLNGRPWTPSTVSLFLRSPRNAGLRSHIHHCSTLKCPTDHPCGMNGKTEIVGRGTWEPLVDEFVWRSVQSVLDAPGRRPGPKSVTKHLLTGMLLCGKPDCPGRLGGRWVMWQTGGQPGRAKAGQVKHPGGERGHSITYTCKACRGVSMRADDVEPLVFGVVAARLAEPDAVDLLKLPQHDQAATERLRDDRTALTAKLDRLAIDYAAELLTARQVKVATDQIQAEIDAIDRQEQDQDRLRVMDGLPLGTPEVAQALAELTPGRYRAVVDLVCTVTVLPVGKGRRPDAQPRDRLAIDFRQ
ncbi:recombinase family protein [Mycobacterium sp. SMC-17]|uniref:recombinase family protein n=1 Tax=Mycobacterium sp. SMC-17 TaxID=3381628 RepID=UPI003875EBA6